MSKVELTAELLELLKAKAQAATPGPWASWILEGPLLGGNYQVRSSSDPDENFVCRHVESAANSSYIAAASPDMVLALIERIGRLEKESDWLAEGISDLMHCSRLEDCEECSLFDEDSGNCLRDVIGANSSAWREAARKAVEGQL